MTNKPVNSCQVIDRNARIRLGLEPPISCHVNGAGNFVLVYRDWVYELERGIIAYLFDSTNQNEVCNV